MKNYTLITLMGNQDLRSLKAITSNNISDETKRMNKEKKGYGPLLNVLLKVFNSKIGYNINKLILIKEEENFKKKFKGEFEYKKGYEGLKVICEKLNIEFEEEIFTEDKKIIDYDDIYDTLDRVLEKISNNEKVLINITSGIGHWKVATVMFLDSEKKIFMIDVKHEEKEIEINDESKFGKVLSKIKERILKHSFEYSDFDSELVFKGIEKEKNKIDFFIKIATHYLSDEKEKKRIFSYPLLITGDTGTGKTELVKYIKNSLKIDEKFIEFNSAGLADTLIESELFGYVKGAFTGADEDKVGLIKIANKGVLFMDEIGELSLNAQSKLLRVLQDGSYRRVGRNKEEKSYFILIAATNIDLLDEIKKGKFREDLYWRINRVIIDLPAITKRKNYEKIIEEFLKRELKTQNNFFKKMDYNIGSDNLEPIINQISKMKLKGNFRELQKIIRDAIFNNILNKNLTEVNLIIEDFNFIDLNTSKDDDSFLDLIDKISEKLSYYYNSSKNENNEIPLFKYEFKKIGDSINYKIIERLMTRFNLNQDEIAKKLHISDKTVTKYKKTYYDYNKTLYK